LKKQADRSCGISLMVCTAKHISRTFPQGLNARLSFAKARGAISPASGTELLAKLVQQISGRKLVRVITDNLRVNLQGGGFMP
jgi:hypothetical protein